MVLALSVAGATCLCAAQPHGAESDAAVEGYLERLGLKALLAEQLGGRMRQAPADERTRLGERLGKLYLELIGSAATPEERTYWEERARDLVRQMPESQTTELRLEFARMSYARAEETAERVRLRLADAEAKADAERSLRALKAQFEQIGSEVNKREEALARGEARPTDKTEDLQAEARRLRAVAYYYAGWSAYYLAMLSGQESAAVDGLRDFAWLLGRGGTMPSLEKLPRGFFRYDHICRAAIGVALCHSLRGQDVEAMRWLAVVEDDAETPAPIKQQLLGRKIVVLGAARNWPELARAVRGFRGADGAASPQRPLDSPTARLLALVSFEADASVGGPVLQQLRSVAMADLVARGDIANVLDLAQRFGTEPLGDQGFIVHYVRGVQAFERTSAGHKASGADPEQPSTDASIVNAYRDAARLLAIAQEQPDADRYPGERTRSLILAGRALFLAGDFAPAGERFELAAHLAQAANDAKQAQESLWLAVVSLDRIASAPGAGPSRAAEKLEAISTLFIRTYPGTERAATLLLRRSVQGKIKDEEALAVLLAVPAESTIYEPARRQAARLLYRLYRSAPAEDRAFASQRFVAVAEAVLAVDRKHAMQPGDGDHGAAVERVIVGGRQLLDALLGAPTPDVAKAADVLEIILAVAGYNNTDLGPYQDELTFRRFQIAVATDKLTDAVALTETLRRRAEGAKERDSAAARYAVSAQRILYNRAVQQYRKARLTGGSDAPGYAAAAREVVRHGVAVVDQLNARPESFKDPAVVSLYNTVAQAAAEANRLEADPELLRVSVRLDTALVRAVPGHVEGLTRLAECSEALGDGVTALECWRTLSAGLDAGTEAWFRARYETIRLLLASDVAGAAEAIAQHRVLYPAYGPAPWGDKIRGLEQRLPPPPPPGGQTPATGGGG